MIFFPGLDVVFGYFLPVEFSSELYGEPYSGYVGYINSGYPDPGQG